MSAPTSLMAQLFLADFRGASPSVSSTLGQRLLHVACPVRGRRTAVIAGSRNVAEAERLAGTPRLDEPALAGLSAGHRGDEGVDHPLRVEQRHPDAGQTLAGLLADDV